MTSAPDIFSSMVKRIKFMTSVVNIRNIKIYISVTQKSDSGIP